MVWVDYAQLEGDWISAGGSRADAPLMAAIALAESGEMHNGKIESNSDAVNPNDNGGKQSSFGSWQVSNGTHLPPIGNWNDPVANAGQAVKIKQSQGLHAWGTFTTGKYKQFLKGGVPPQQGSNPGASLDSIWQWLFGGAATGIAGSGGAGLGGLLGAAKFFTALANPAFWMRAAKGGIGIGLMIVGLYLMLHDTGPAKAARATARRAGKDAAAGILLGPK